MKKRILALVLALSLLLSACGGGGDATAATMHLRKTEGTVGVSDGEGKALEPAENLGLYSGYGVDTQSESYAWIDLDDVKLTKLDENSQVEIRKEDKHLTIEVKSGSLFFNVTEPLAEDETLDIRTSTMLVGIRGTCGWVAQDTVALLEGTVEVTAGDQTATVNAGEMAVLTDGALEVKPFTVRSIPTFVADEVEDDEELVKAILEDSGLDVTEDPLAPYARALDGREVLYTEFIDFEADGSPELLVIFAPVSEKQGDSGYTYTNTEGSAEIYRAGPEGLSWPYLVEVTWTSFITEYDYDYEYDGERIYKLSLVESGGRLFLEQYYSVTQQESTSIFSLEQYAYYGSAAPKDGSRQEWGRIDELRCIRRDYPNKTGTPSYQRVDSSGDGLRHGALHFCTAEEYETIPKTYHEVRVLTYSVNGNYVITPDPAGEAGTDPGSDTPAPVDPMRLRDMYTYSRSMNYTADGKWILTDEFFPDEQGRIGRMVLHDGTDGSESVIEYIYNDAGTLSQRVRADGTVVSTITEDTADHRTIISPTHPENEYVYYYDEQGHTIRAEYFTHGGSLTDYYTYTYDAEGKLIRVDNYSADGTLTNYSLYEYD